jgi:outer membrane PBP1 activator LpoA protein
MRFARRISRFAILAAALALAGCPSLSERIGPPPSVDRAAALEDSGDDTGAARVYEALAAQNSGSERNDLLLHAARDYLKAQRPDDAARVLTRTEATQSAAQQTERTMLAAELALQRGDGAEARRELDSIAPPREPQQAARYAELRARAARAAGGAAGVPPAAVAAEQPGPHIALLVPVTGRAASAAISVRDGFLTAYYQAPPAERPRVRIYDTGTAGVAELISRASGQGADLIVGPLTREEVVAAAQFTGPRPPVLALNFLPTEQPAPASFYQYALSPEDEARLVARRILEDHHRRGVALAPQGDWGSRVLAAFKQELVAGGGDLIATASFDPALTDFTDAITTVLGISDSQARYHRLESILGTRLQFEPRRRTDIEFIFAPAQASTERLLRPQLRYHYAGDIATYATSDAFEPDVRLNQDLEGLMFPAMPWMLGGDLAEAVRAAAREAWPSGALHRNRLFAFGFDAYRLAQALRNRSTTGAVHIDGLTGRLSFDAERRVQRELDWAELHDGELRLLPAAAAAAGT